MSPPASPGAGSPAAESPLRRGSRSPVRLGSFSTHRPDENSGATRIDPSPITQENRTGRDLSKTSDQLSEMSLEATSGSVSSILRNQQANGAIVASPDFAEYHYCWLRDGSFIAYALDQVGQHDASARYHSWVNQAIEGISELIDRAIEWHQQERPLHPDHMPPARFALDGSNVVDDDWPNFQIDGYGTWLWSLGQHLLSTGQSAATGRVPWLGRTGRPLSRCFRPDSMFRRLGRKWHRSSHLHPCLRLRWPDSRGATAR